MNDPEKWDRRFMELAQLVATWSKDRSRGIGCVIVSSSGTVLSTGYNGFPRGCFDSGEDADRCQRGSLVRAHVEARHERPLKYRWVEHAERNAVYNAARNGIKLEGAHLYVPWFPCTDCMRAIIQSGIVLLVCTQPNLNEPRWGEDFQIAAEMANEVGLRVIYMSTPDQAQVA